MNYIKEKLSFLEANQEKSNTIISKEFFLNPALPASAFFAIENNLMIRFPEDYRDFITQIANGCIGPDYGLLSIQESMIDFKLETKPAIDLSIPFHYSES